MHSRLGIDGTSSYRRISCCIRTEQRQFSMLSVTVFPDTLPDHPLPSFSNYRVMK